MAEIASERGGELKFPLRTYVGALVYDLLPFIRRTMPKARLPRSAAWVWNRNRQDEISVGTHKNGVTCHLEHTRDLHVTRVFPQLSTFLLRRMLRDWPIYFREQTNPSTGPIDVSFVIGHRGTVRLPHLLLTLKSIAAQRSVNFECIVVEQSFQPEIASSLPRWVKYIHTKTPSAEYLYNRSWTLNAGVNEASGRIVILHDNDMLVPESYAAEFVHAADQGGQVFNLKRFITYLDEPSTRWIFGSQSLTGNLRSEAVVQNLCAGGSLGLLRDAYYAIGGMDEDFVGWGGEDTEFWDRCQTLEIVNSQYLPIVHLWHPSQPGKAAVKGLGSSTVSYFSTRMAENREARIDDLRSKSKRKTTLKQHLQGFEA